MHATEPATEGGAAAPGMLAPVAPGGARLCVLASGSKGNCTVLAAGERTILLDAGLSPRRTGAMLREVGLSLSRVTDIVFTHLDHDHCHPGWCASAKGGGAPHALVHVHRAHRGRADRMGLLARRSRWFDETVRLDERPDGSHERVRIDAALASHDSLGVAAFRVRANIGAGEAHLGFATDLGHVPGAIVEHLRGVDALAIESNYCPQLQEASDRPEFLKRRIMGGSGHLSNAQCAEAVRRIAPRPGAPVVLLHLSEECNEPARALAAFDGAPWRIVASAQRAATGWIDLRPLPAPATRPEPRPDENPVVRATAAARRVIQPAQGLLWA